MVLFAVLARVALVVSSAVVIGVPAAVPSPRERETVIGFARRVGDPAFLRPVAALAGVTGALSAGVGFLPVLGLRSHLSTIVTGACVSLLAASSIVAQLWAGRALDRGRLSSLAGLAAGRGIATAGLTAAAWLPGTVGLVVAALVIGAGVGTATPLGFAALAQAAPLGARARRWAQPRSDESSAMLADRSWWADWPQCLSLPASRAWQSSSSC